MSKSTLTRRALVASTAAMPAAAALGLPAAASLPAANDAVSDKKLRRLWSKYLNDVAEYEAVCAKYEPARAAFEVELPPCPEDVVAGDHWRAHQWLWNKHGLEPLWDAWNAAHDAVGKTVKAIQQTRADSFFGLGVKLAALPIEHDEDDWQDAVKSALQDVDHLLGSEFGENVRGDWMVDEAQSMSTVTPDPIFAAIEHFRAANDTFSAACKGEPSWSSPEHEEWYSRNGAAADVEQDALMDMLEVRPTTKAGAVALSNAYLENYRHRDSSAVADKVLELIVPHLV